MTKLGSKLPMVMVLIKNHVNLDGVLLEESLSLLPLLSESCSRSLGFGLMLRLFCIQTSFTYLDTAHIIIIDISGAELSYQPGQQHNNLVSIPRVPLY
jgi:hypothetical protein